MALHLVGETLDRHRAFAGAQAGTLVSVFRGIYVDANDDIDKVVLDHAVRIARLPLSEGLPLWRHRGASGAGRGTGACS